VTWCYAESLSRRSSVFQNNLQPIDINYVSDFIVSTGQGLRHADRRPALYRDVVITVHHHHHHHQSTRTWPVQLPSDVIVASSISQTIITDNWWQQMTTEFRNVQWKIDGQQTGIYNKNELEYTAAAAGGGDAVTWRYSKLNWSTSDDAVKQIGYVYTRESSINNTTQHTVLPALELSTQFATSTTVLAPSSWALLGLAPVTRHCRRRGEAREPRMLALLETSQVADSNTSCWASNIELAAARQDYKKPLDRKTETNRFLSFALRSGQARALRWTHDGRSLQWMNDEHPAVSPWYIAVTPYMWPWYWTISSQSCVRSSVIITFSKLLSYKQLNYGTIDGWHSDTGGSRRWPYLRSLEVEGQFICRWLVHATIHLLTNFEVLALKYIRALWRTNHGHKRGQNHGRKDHTTTSSRAQKLYPYAGCNRPMCIFLSV